MNLFAADPKEINEMNKRSDEARTAYLAKEEAAAHHLEISVKSGKELRALVVSTIEAHAGQQIRVTYKGEAARDYYDVMESTEYRFEISLSDIKWAFAQIGNHNMPLMGKGKF